MASTFKAARTHNRKFPGKHGARPDRYEERVREGAERAKERAGRTAADQIALLDHRLGVGVGATRERKMLAEPKKAKK